MIQEEKDLLLSLLKKADKENLLHIYDYDDTYYYVDWIFSDNNTINIKIKPI